MASPELLLVRMDSGRSSPGRIRAVLQALCYVVLYSLLLAKVDQRFDVGERCESITDIELCRCLNKAIGKLVVKRRVDEYAREVW